MSDNMRQSFSDKAESNLKPDSQKSTTERMGESIKGTWDSAAATLQPQSEKSTTQEMGDTFSGDTFSGSSGENDRSMLDKAKDTVGMGDK